MRRGAGRIKLHGDSGIEDLPARSKICRGIDQSRCRLLTVHCHEITLWSIDAMFARGKPGLRKPRRHYTVARGSAGMKWFHHGSDVLLQTARQRGRDSENVTGGRRIELKEPSHRCCSSESSNRGSAVPAALVVMP